MPQNDSDPVSQCQELLQCYNRALDNYCKKRPRADCAPTFFTRFRHSFREYTALLKLRKKLSCAKQTISALTLVIDHFISKKSNFNNHSFNNYFIDELKNSPFFKQIDWDCFTPKAVKKYTGLLYRGDTRPPQVIFASGFTEKCSANSVSTYLKYHNGSIGISASKDFDVAIDYANKAKKRGCAKKNPQRGNSAYVYVINYCESNGFDILKTGQARGLNFSNIFRWDRAEALRNEEVNIKGTINAEMIVGAFEIQNGELYGYEIRNKSRVG